jgi:hypothetical protein
VGKGNDTTETEMLRAQQVHEPTTTTDAEHGHAGPAPWGRLTATSAVSLPNLGDAQFAMLVFERGIPHTAEVQWATTATSLDPILPQALATVRAERSKSALAELEAPFGERSLVLVTLRRGTIHARIAAAEQALVAEIESWLREAFPGVEPSERPELLVRFWSCGSHGASSITRTIDVPSLVEIEANYPVAVREQLRTLSGSSFKPAESGQLLLWYGPPGTGKTYAIRALGWEWRDWCELHYVIDPEVFFGQRADYMIDVLLEDDDRLALDDTPRQQPAKWRLLILEDTGELLAADARERTGQGLSRLLNLVDGIVGQGLRVLVLVTTNEPLRRLHPAVARPGRCAARVEFEPFSADEAVAWLAAHDLPPTVPGAATLAQLFARLRRQEPEPERTIGFGLRE